MLVVHEKVKKWPKVAISASTKWPFSAHKWAIKVVRSKMQSIKSNYLLQKKIKAKLMLRSRTWKENLSKGSEMVLVYLGVHLGYSLDITFVIFCILYSPLVCYKKVQPSKKTSAIGGRNRRWGRHNFYYCVTWWGLQEWWDTYEGNLRTKMYGISLKRERFFISVLHWLG